MQAPYRQFTAMLRLIAALNGAAALLLTAFSLGAIGGDIDAPDLSEPVEYFLAGVVACGLAQLLIFLVQLRREQRLRQSRPPGGRLGLILAMLAFAGAVAGFAMGCWTAVSGGGGDDSGQDSNTQAVYMDKLPTAYSLAIDASSDTI